VNGPLLPFVATIDRCGAARQTGHSPQVHNPAIAEFTVCGQSGPSPQLF